ncbi:MAG: hypothetical protein Q4G27_03395 [Flavobacteriaceae bacterium]|nr:hypothetical protein [Flavobacteriaceae bacterium]
MNKLTNTLLFTLISVMSFAQEARPERAAAREGSFETPAYGGGGMEALAVNDAPGHGGEFAPIDDYSFLLIGIAVLMIAYVIYRRNQLVKA